MVAVLGVVSVLSAVYPPVRHRLTLLVEVVPAYTPRVAAGVTAAVGLMLLSLASGLARRKKQAWRVAVAASAALVLLHLLKGLDVEEAMLAAVVLALLLIAAPAFTGLPDPRSPRRVVQVLIASFLAATATGAIATLADPDEVTGPIWPTGVLRQIWLGMVGLPGPLQYDSVGARNRTDTILVLLGLTVVALTLAAALRPAGGPHPIRTDEAVRVRELLAAHGGNDSLGYFALRDDKAVIFSPSGKASIAYRVLGGTSLAAGDPLGDVEAWPGAIEAWLQQARTYAWLPAVLGASERAAEVYRRFGLDALELGDEAVIHVADFSVEGRPMRAVRQAVGKLRRKGFTVAIDRAEDLPDDELATAAAACEAWRGSQVERGFSMALGRFADPRDPQLLVVRCHGVGGELLGLLSFVPWGVDGISLDLMRRSPEADNGVTELMVTTVLAQADQLGITRMSLNFAVFRAAFERGGRLGAGPVLRVWHRILLSASRFWQIESLYRASAKYRPTWEPRFVCFARARDLARVGAAALEAEAFIARPRWLGGASTTAPPHLGLRKDT